MTYRGDRATISSNTSTLVKDSAFNIANLTLRKVLDIITIVTAIVMLGILGGGFFTYRYLKSESFQKQMMDKVLGEVQGLMPDVLGNALPDMTGPSLPIKKQPTLPKF